MSKETINLKLFKYDTATDGNSTFNIDTALNGNWDKVDTDSKVKADAIAEVKNQVNNITVPVKSVNTKTGDVVLNAADIKAADGTTLEQFKETATTQLSDMMNHIGDSTKHITSLERTTWNGKLDKSGGTMVGVLTAQNNTSYTTKQVRNITLSTTTPSGGANGDVWLTYV